MWPMQRGCCSCDLWTKNQLSGGVNPTAWHTHTHGCCCHCLHHNWGLHIQDLASYLHRVLHWRLYCLPVTVEHFRSLQDCQTTRSWEENHSLLTQLWGRTSNVQQLTSELLEVLSEWMMKKNWMIYQYCLTGLTSSLLWCHLKTTIKSVKFETFQPFCFLFRTGI